MRYVGIDNKEVVLIRYYKVRGMGVVGAISLGIGNAIAWAVNKGLTSVDVGVNVPRACLKIPVN